MCNPSLRNPLALPLLLGAFSMKKVTVLERASIRALVAFPFFFFAAAPIFAQSSTAAVKVNPLRDAYYGDLHLHTSYSLDAYLAGTTRVDPDQAYRFAKGELVQYLGQPVRRREPLDFLAVTDHSETIGSFSELENPNSAVSRSDLGKKIRAVLMSVT